MIELLRKVRAPVRLLLVALLAASLLLTGLLLWWLREREAPADPPAPERAALQALPSGGM